MGVKISDLTIDVVSDEGIDYVEISRQISEETFETWRIPLGTMASKNSWQGTQAEYDALGSYDSNTIYFIQDEEES